MKSKKEFILNHEYFEVNIEDLIKNGLEIISDNFQIKNQKHKKLKELLLESFLLRSCAYWENFLEKEIVLLVKLNPDTFKNYFNLQQNIPLNENLIRGILIGDKYRDWHDIQALKSYFQKIINHSINPFIELTSEQFEIINFTYTLRNYLSHYSEYSKKKLLSTYKKNYSYKKFIEPGSFLLKNKGRYFEKLLHNFILISITTRKKLGVPSGIIKIIE
jgi:hypothetical protein